MFSDKKCLRPFEPDRKNLALFGAFISTLCICMITGMSFAGDNAKVISFHGKQVESQDLVTALTGKKTSGQQNDDQLPSGLFPGDMDMGSSDVSFRGIQMHNEMNSSQNSEPQQGSSEDNQEAAQAAQSIGGCPTEDVAIALDIKFSINSADLESSAYRTLREVASAMMAPELVNCRFRVEGHTDASGGDKYNLALSEERAVVVAKFLHAYDISSDRMLVVGKGETDILYKNNPYAKENRRVQFSILGSNQ
jgi:outer membrane protein OmpA-like peptidoglycan-associated protein